MQKGDEPSASESHAANRVAPARDDAAHTVREIRENCPGVGPKTIARINETLAEIGLRLVEK